MPWMFPGFPRVNVAAFSPCFLRLRPLASTP